MQSQNTTNQVVEIPLTQDKVALIDAADYERVSSFKWIASKHQKTYYATSTTGGPHQFRKQIALHRLILDAPSGTQVDHIDHNGLNCQRYNLRLCNESQNGANRIRNLNNTSGYKGVTWNKRRKKWHGKTKHEGSYIHLGFFNTAEEAAYAYDAKVRELFGEFALTNF